MSLSKRKSPYRHRVKNHVRNGHSVNEYRRGKGKKPKFVKPIVVGAKNVGVFSRWDVKIEHDDGSKETFRTDSNTFLHALNRGLSRRKSMKGVKSLTLMGVR